MLTVNKTKNKLNRNRNAMTFEIRTKWHVRGVGVRKLWQQMFCFQNCKQTVENAFSHCEVAVECTIPSAFQLN